MINIFSLVDWNLVLRCFNIAFLLFLAGVFDGKMDYIKLYSLDRTTWVNKYAKGEIPYIKKWYYFGLHTPKYAEAFAFSSTVLVSFTDKWHLYKLLSFGFLELAIMFIFVPYSHLHWWYVPLGILLLKACRGLGFTLIYDKKA